MGAKTNKKLEVQIVETAKQLFIEKGFVEASMCDIAAKVGINRPTLHYYFRTKDRMFQAVFSSIVEGLFPKVTDIVHRGLPFMECVSLLLDAYIDYFKEHPYMPKFVCEEIQRDVDHLLDTLEAMHMDETFHLIQKNLLAEMERGELKKVPLPIVFFTFYGLITFPFLAQNLMTKIFAEDSTPFLEEWKGHVLSQMRSLLCVE